MTPSAPTCAYAPALGAGPLSVVVTTEVLT